MSKWIMSPAALRGARALMFGMAVGNLIAYAETDRNVYAITFLMNIVAVGMTNSALQLHREIDEIKRRLRK